ncbi:DUF11 domain-containing protein [Corynebacterium choanae]|uniref:Translocon-associated protein beta (TRAPB) n=1 Tax=Corynebacterium choanae TaxID=1862358 RepID=A0A3G6J8X3_9CORY|nr:DUF11 domain-containing protein [Corynebacterium choanae]AZA14436.1 Translocon-associated protein beta (TRAPB) [Corynebacterium choanae]
MFPLTRSSQPLQSPPAFAGRRLLALLCSLVLAVAGIQIVAEPPVAHADIDGVKITTGDATAELGSQLAVTFNLNCSVSCQGLRIQLQRPEGVGGKPLVSSGFTVENADSDHPVLVYTKSGTDGLVTASAAWETVDHPGFAAKADIPWTATLNGNTTQGTIHTAITGKPKTSLKKGVSNQIPVPGQRVVYTIEYVREHGLGVTGYTGTIVDEIPAGLEEITIVNQDLTPGTTATYEQAVDAREYSKVIKARELSADYIHYDPETRKITIDIDKSVDAALSRERVAKITYTAKVNDTVANATRITNTVKLDPDSLHNLDGTKLASDAPGVAQPVERYITVRTAQGSVGKGGTGQQNKNNTDIQFYIRAKRPGTNDIFIDDQARIQQCLQYKERAFQSDKCTVPGGDNKQHLALTKFQVDAVTNFQQVASDNGQPQWMQSNSRPTVTFTVFNADRSQSKQLPVLAGETSNAGNATLKIPDDLGFAPVHFTAVVQGVPSDEYLTVRSYHRVTIPDELYVQNDDTRLDYVDAANDVTITYKEADGTDTKLQAGTMLNIYENLPDPKTGLVVVDNPTITGPEVSSNIRYALYNLSEEAFPPLGYISVPKGFSLDPSVLADQNWQECNDQATLEPGKVAYNPGLLQWELLAEGSPSGGQLWRFTAPDNVVVPGKSENRPCQFTIPVTSTGALGGTYSNPDLESQFPAFRIMVTTANPNQGLAKSSTFQANPYGIGWQELVAACRDNPANCQQQTQLCVEDPDSQACEDARSAYTKRKRWVQADGSLTVLDFAESRIEKYAWGDKDPTRDTRTTALAPQEGVADTSWATQQATFFLRVGTDGSVPYTDYVLYDALPTEESWVPINSKAATQEATAGTHKIYDQETGKVTSTAVNDNTLVPTLTGPIAIPVQSLFNEDLQKWERRAPRATIHYSTSSNPCRPEMAEAKQGPFPAEAQECTAFNAREGEWLTAEEVNATADGWSKIRYFRIAFEEPISGLFDIPVPMTMPTNDVSGNGIGDSDIAINRVAFRASNGKTNTDLGTLSPAAARVKYVPEYKINKSLLLPDVDGTFSAAKNAIDGADSDSYLVGVGDNVLFRITVTGKVPGVMLESPMIRDFIPPGLELVEVMTGTDETGALNTVGEVYSDYHDPVADAAVAAAADDGVIPQTPTAKVAWFPGPMDDQGVVNPQAPDGSRIPAQVTLKLRVTGDPVGVLHNVAFGTTREQASVPSGDSCAEKTPDDIAAGRTDNNCDRQSINVASAISGALFSLPDSAAADAELDDSTAKVTTLQPGDVQVQLLAADGSPLLVNPTTGKPDREGSPLIVNLGSDGTYRFPKVRPGNYQVQMTVKDDPAARERFQQAFMFTPATVADQPIAASGLIDGAVDDKDPFTAVTKTFTVPGPEAPGGQQNVPHVDFAVIQTNPSLTITKSPTTDTPRNLNDQAEFTINGSNNGNVPLTGVRLHDEWASSRNVTPVCVITDQTGKQRSGTQLLTTDGTTLAVGEQYSCTVTYTVAQADIDNQEPLHNTAKITGMFGKTPLEETSSAAIPVHTADPSFTLDKQLENSTDLHVGDAAVFLITFTNTGNVTLHNVAISDKFSAAETVINLVCAENKDGLDATKATDAVVTIPTVAPNGVIYCRGQFIASKEFLENQTKEVNVAAAVPSYMRRDDNGDLVPTLLQSATAEAAVQPRPSQPAIEVKKEVATGADSFGHTTQGSLENGGVIPFRITLTNTGDVRLTQVTITDELTGRDAGAQHLEVQRCVDAASQGAVGGNGKISLAAGEQVICSATITYTQDDIDAQHPLVNTVSVTAQAKQLVDDKEQLVTVTEAEDRTDDNAATVTPPAPAPSLEMQKTAAAPRAILLPGDTVPYTFVITNNGNQTVHDVAVEDEKFPGGNGITCAGDTRVLQPQESLTCTGTYTVTDTDAVAEKVGQLVNTAVATGKSPTNNAVRSASSTVTLPTGRPKLQLEKVVVPTEGVDLNNVQPDDVVTFRMTVTNVGSAPIDKVAIKDPIAQQWGAKKLVCPIVPRLGHDVVDYDNGVNGFLLADTDTEQSIGWLASQANPEDAQAVCLVSFAFPQAAIDQGVEHVNTATAVGVDAVGTEYESPQASAKVTGTQEGGLTLEKSSSATVDGPLVVGDEINYHFKFTNTGKVTLHNITLADELLSGRGIDPATFCPPFDLAPAAVHTCQSPVMSVTDADVDTTIANTATFSSEWPTSSFTAAPPAGSSNEVRHLVTKPEISLDKSVVNEKTGGFAIGDQVIYKLTVTNTGLVPVTGVYLEDQMLEARMDSDPEKATASRAYCPDHEDILTPAGASLAPEESATCYIGMMVTQADVDAGPNVVNEAYSAAETRQATATDRSTAVVNFVQTAELALTKAIDAAQPVYTEGDVVHYVFTVENTGQLTVRDITIDDPMLAEAGTTITCDKQLTKPGLAAGESAQCRADYVVTAADAAAAAATHTVTNTATAKGQPVRGEVVTSPPAEVSFQAGSPAMSIAKFARIVAGATGDLEHPQVQAGSVVEWSMVVTNSGNATAHDVQVTDALLADAADAACYANVSEADRQAGKRPAAGGTALDAIGDIAAGSTVTCFASTTITQAQVDGGVDNQTVNTAAVTRAVDNPGTDDPARTTAVQATAKVDNATKAGISLTKEVAPESAKQQYVAGDEIVYTFTVTNTGLVSLHDIAITDELFAAAAAGIVCQRTTLAPGEHTTCTSPVYTVTAADAEREHGALLNEAVVTATTPTDRTNLDGVNEQGQVTDSSEVTVTVGTPAISLTKTATPQTGVSADDMVTYTIIATNSGNTDLYKVHVTDPWFSADELSCSAAAATDPATGADLAVGEMITCTASRLLTQDEVDAGTPVENTATVTAESDGIATATTVETGQPVSVEATATARVTPSTKAALTLEKTVQDKQSIYAEGDEVAYQFVVTNTGDVTIHDVTLTDPLIDDTVHSCTPDRLAPGEQATCPVLRYTITADDVTRQAVANTATVTGLSPAQDDTTPVDQRPTASATAQVVTGYPAITITKTSDIAPGTQLVAGDTITYTIEIVNTGTTPATAVKLIDPMVAEVGEDQLHCSDPAVYGDGPGATLAQPNDAVNCTLVRKVSADDVNRFDAIANTATAEATFGSKQATPVSATATAPVASEPKISLVKQVKDPQTVYLAGDAVVYTFTITNEGTVDVTDVTINDALLASRSIAITCPATDLAVGATMVCESAPLTVTDDDVATGRVDNTATVVANVPRRAISNEDGREGVVQPPVISNESQHSISTGTPALSIEKVAATQQVSPGETVRYTITVRNIGTTPVEKIRISDDQILDRGGKFTCDDPAMLSGEGVLPVGATTTCVASEIASLPEDGSLQLHNTATVQGSYRNAKVTKIESTATVALNAPKPQLTAKIFDGSISDGDGQTPATAVELAPGEDFTVDFKLTNTGEGPLTAITVEVPGANFDTLALTILDDTGQPVTAIPTAQTPVTGLVLRVADDGNIILSAEETLPALALPPRYELSGNLRVDSAQIGHNTPITVEAADPRTGETVTARDDFFTKQRPAAPAGITTKLYIGEPTADTDGHGDGQTDDTAVQIPADTPVDVTLQITNTGQTGISGIVPTITGAGIDLKPGQVFILRDGDGNPATPEMAAAKPGLMLRVTGDGEIVFSDDEHNLPLLLAPGQQVTAALTITVAPGNTDHVAGTVSATDSQHNALSDNDPLYVMTGKPVDPSPEPSEPTKPTEPTEPLEPSTPGEPPVSSASSSKSPWWVVLVPVVGMLPVLAQLPGVPVPPIVSTAVPTPEAEVEQPEPRPDRPEPRRSGLLAQTGANVGTLSLLAVLLMVIGLVLVAARRRKGNEM